MGKADFVRTKYFARAADCVVFGMIEIVVVGNVGANLRREELRIKAGSLVRGLPFNQVQSAKAKGSALGSRDA
jgi:hypothetical protein